MRLKTISYKEWQGTSQEWILETLSFSDRMLLVGRNTAGKSRSLSIINGLASLIIGNQQLGLAGDYSATFDNDGISYLYELRYFEQEIIHERIVINEREHLRRGTGGEGVITAEKINNGEIIDFQAPPTILATVARRDKIQHSFIEPLYEWANSLRYYKFNTLPKDFLTVFTPNAPKFDERDQNAVTGIFRDGLKQFGDEFIQSIKIDLAKVDYDIEDIGIGSPVSIRFLGGNGGPEPVSINVREKGLQGLIDQIGMSTGMFRVLAIIILVNYAQFKGSASSILIDDIGEGLDFERSVSIIELLRTKSIQYGFQLTMSTNDKFVMNNVPLDEWTILHREGSTVHVRNKDNSANMFNEFKFTGLSNFSFFEMNSTNPDKTYTSEGKMRRLAIFVEGFTELLFIDSVITAIANKNNIVVHQKKFAAAAVQEGKKTIQEIKLSQPIQQQSHYVLIYDCGGDNLVAQRVREEHDSLSRAGYEKIIGIRDVYPQFTKAEVPKLRQGMQTGIKTRLAPVQFILSVMEIEAWFLSEYNHFNKIDPTITLEAIRSRLGFCPENDDMSDRHQPTADLSSAYQIGSQTYVKGAAQGTVDKLDYDFIYLSLRNKIPDLANLLDSIDTFLT